MDPDTPEHELLDRLERYYDAVPRTGSQVEPFGPFMIFVPQGGFPLYARPRLGLTTPITADEVRAVTERQRALGVPQALEWVAETTPSLAEAARAVGFTVSELPLLVLREPRAVPAPDGVVIRRIQPDEPALRRILAVAAVAFGHAGTATGPAGPHERDRHAAADQRDHARLRERLAAGLTIMVVAEDERGPIASGAHQPVGDVSEVVGVATLPSARRRGLGVAITSMLVADALAAGVKTVFLSAASDDVARIYERLGFVRVAHAGIAEPAPDPAATT